MREERAEGERTPCKDEACDHLAIGFVDFAAPALMEISGEGIDTVTAAFDLHEVDSCLEYFLLELRLLCRLLPVLMGGIDNLLLACLSIFNSNQCAFLYRLIG